MTQWNENLKEAPKDKNLLIKLLDRFDEEDVQLMEPLYEIGTNDFLTWSCDKYCYSCRDDEPVHFLAWKSID